MLQHSFRSEGIKYHDLLVEVGNKLEQEYKMLHHSSVNGGIKYHNLLVKVGV